MDLKKEKRIKKEVAEFDKELKDAVAKKDKAKEEKLKKKQPQINRLRVSSSGGRFKVTLITWVPFILLYYLMTDFVGGCSLPAQISAFLFHGPTAAYCFGEVVIHSPIPLPIIVAPDGSMVLIWWYFLSSLTFSTIVSKLLGTQP